MNKNILLNNNEIKIPILFKSGVIGYKINDLSYAILQDKIYHMSFFGMDYFKDNHIEMPNEYKIKYFIKLTSKLRKVTN